MNHTPAWPLTGVDKKKMCLRFKSKYGWPWEKAKMQVIQAKYKCLDTILELCTNNLFCLFEVIIIEGMDKQGPTTSEKKNAGSKMPFVQRGSTIIDFMVFTGFYCEVWYSWATCCQNEKNQELTLFLSLQWYLCKCRSSLYLAG